MNFNGYHSQYNNRQPYDNNRQPYGYYQQQQPYQKPPSQDDILERGELRIDQKTFILTLKENQRGRFLQIAENKDQFHQTIIVPGSGLEDFLAIFNQLMEADREMPPALPTQASQAAQYAEQDPREMEESDGR